MFLEIYSDVNERLYTTIIAHVVCSSEYVLKLANKLE